MDLGLDGKVALIVAASQGLGLAVATRLAQEGAHVIICARDPERLDAARTAIRIETGHDSHAISADMSDPLAVRRLADAALALYGKLDILINNCGGPRAGRAADLAMSDWDQAYGQVMRGTIELTTACLPALKATHGTVVNLSSYSVKQPIPDLMLSNAFRLGLIGWSKSLALDLAPSGVRVNNVCPGWAYTDRVARLLEEKARTTGRSISDLEQEIVSSIPLGRMATPAEIADVVAFLASPRAAYVTGTVLCVDGGATQSTL